MHTFANQILEWNRKRGLLDSFNPGLSMKLLSEEAKEFFKAETLPEMLCEYADFWFVWLGYKSIAACCPVHPVDLDVAVKSMMSLESWFLSIENHMTQCLLSKYRSEYISDNLDRWALLQNDSKKAMAFVIQCNEQKSSKKNEDGKIVKADNQLRPVPLMQEFLDHRQILPFLRNSIGEIDEYQGY